MSKVDWNDYSRKGLLQAVIDPMDTKGYKNQLIDLIHWNTLRAHSYNSKKLLDFGCGSGRFSARIANLGINYTGIDSSIGMVETSRQHNLKTSLNFICSDGKNLPFYDNSFDTCLSTYVLQYVINGPDTKEIMSELQRILVPGGRLLLIEQVSLSNKTSGSVERVSKEIDYIKEMSNYFTIKHIKRIRSCGFSRITNIALWFSDHFPIEYKFIVALLATFETWRTRTASENYLTNVDYYEIFIEAIKNGERN